MNSEDLKTEFMAFLRYLRRCEMVCTEVGAHSADVWGLTDTRLIEIETKVSIADLRADFNKPKHQLYQRRAAEAPERHQVPNAFYFGVPADLVEKAQAFLATVELPVAKKYGIISASPQYHGYLGRNAVVVQKAGRLHSQAPTAHTREVALLRMASELCGTRQALATHRRLFAQGYENLTAALNDLYSRQELQAQPALEEV